MREVHLELILSEYNVKFFFTDAREFKKRGNMEMYEKAVKHILYMKRRMEDARRQIRWRKEQDALVWVI